MLLSILTDDWRFFEPLVIKCTKIAQELCIYEPSEKFSDRRIRQHRSEKQGVSHFFTPLSLNSAAFLDQKSGSQAILGLEKESLQAFKLKTPFKLEALGDARRAYVFYFIFYADLMIPAVN